MRKKKLVILIFALFLISPIIISFWTIPNTLTFTSNDDQGESTKFKLEAPKLSNGNNWILDGLGICTAYYHQNIPKIVSDGQGGAIIAWIDRRSGYGIYAQKVDSRGNKQWQINGMPVITQSENQYDLKICSDGAGGAIIAWIDNRNSNNDIYAQRINSNGNIQWLEDGNAICTISEDQDGLEICYDGAGGAIITWYDYRNSNNDIFAQRIDSNGITQWIDNGTAICTVPQNGYYPKICSDGAGGAIIAWLDDRGVSYDIYAQRINSNGVTQWTNNGTAICTENSWQEHVELCSDGAGGAIIIWSDSRNGNYDIFAQLIGFNGNTQWTTNGTAVCTYSGSQENPQICSDEAGGAVISWVDYRNSNNDIYAQRINSIGNAQWTTDGVALTTAVNTQSELQISSDGQGGAIVTWTDYRNSNYDIYAQKVDSNGVLLLTENGAAICIAIDNQNHPQICSIGEGSAIITWEDYRGQYKDIFAQRVFNYSGDAELTIVTPESKLYTEPMSGYYSATFGFENDEIGDDPTDWYTEEAGGTVQILNTYSGHSKVVELHETSDDVTEIYTNMVSKSSGTVEWWTSVNRNDDWYELGIFNGDTNDGIHMSFANDGYLKYHDGSVWNVIMPYSANIWYNFKVEWHSATDWHLWINKSSQDGGMGYSYRNSPSSLDRVRFKISDAGIHQDQYMYVDAVGFSWDPYYNLGDNWNEGLLLSMDLNSSLFTLEFKLDNQLNVSISGDTIIPLPNDGRHSITLSGSTFLRDYVQSETVYFTIDTKLPIIQIHAPIQSEAAGEKPPFIMVSITEANVVSKWYTIDESDTIYDLPGLFGLVDANAWDAVPLGPVTIRVYVEDIAGNIVFKEVTFQKELQVPVSLIFNILIIGMFAVIGVFMVLVFREMSVQRER